MATDGPTPKPCNPTTFKELKKSPIWRSTLRLLTRNGGSIMVAEGEACMGRYSAVVLTGKGFQLERGKSGMTAAFSRNIPERTSIKTVKEVVKMALQLSGPLSDDPPDTPVPTETEIIASLLRNIQEVRIRTERR